MDKAATSILSSDRLMVLPMTITINVFRLMTARKRIFSVCALLVLALVMFSSCGEMLFPDNSGFPRKVFLHAEGETKTIKGADLYAISIEPSGAQSNEWSDESEGTESTVSNEWLTVTYNRKTCEMVITAAPNDTRKIRHADVNGMVQDFGVTVRVYQGK